MWLDAYSMVIFKADKSFLVELLVTWEPTFLDGDGKFIPVPYWGTDLL